MASKKSGFGLWYEEHLEGKALPFLLITGLAVLVLLYLTGAMAEQIAALLLGIAIVLGSCAYALRHLYDAARTPRETAVSFALAVGTAILAGIPLVTTLVPGSPEAQGNVTSKGDMIHLPKGLHGPVRLLIHGRVGGQSAGDTQVVFGIGDERVNSHLSRKPTSVRMGRRGRATVMREQNSQFLPVNVPADVDRIRVEEIHGSLGGPMEVSVYSDLLPESVEMILCVLVLILSSAVAARLGAGSAAPGALAVAMLFGIMIHDIATPEIGIQPEMGSLVIGGVGGLLAGTIVTWFCKKLIAKRAEPTAASA